MKAIWTESRPQANIPDGTHSGTITEIIDRPQTDEYQYHYVDIMIKLSDVDATVKYGCPFKMSDKSKLGRLILAFNMKPTVGQEVDLDFLIGQKVSLITLKQGDYSEIVEGSLRPQQ